MAKSSKFFSEAELKCPSTGLCNMDQGFLDRLDLVRKDYGRAMQVTSGYRDPGHNTKIGGAPNSKHMQGLAVDIACTNPADRARIAQLALQHGLTVALGAGFLHLDGRAGGPFLHFYAGDGTNHSKWL
jgi:hypothetical protein